MFTVYSANHTEKLLAELVKLIENTPLSSPFAQESFLVPNPGMERWLSQQLASQFKVWGNYQYLLPSAFFKTIAQKINSHLKDSRFDRNRLLWQIESLLRRPLQETEFAPLVQYLSGDNSALKRYQLARKLAQLFDQYPQYRPDMIAAWQQGQLIYGNTTEAWQKSLWQQIEIAIKGQDASQLWQHVINKLQQTETGSFNKRLPERIIVFGIHQLAPVMLDFLQALAKHCTVYFFRLSLVPTALPVRHPLLASLGQQEQEFNGLLAERDLLPNSYANLAPPKPPQTVLQHLQYDLLANTTTHQALSPDSSISIHACHSRMREVEVLHNVLLAALEQDKQLELRDIIVMAPDIQHYVPFINAVFHDIQHTVANRSLLATNQALNAFIDFLNISQSRFGWQRVVDLLERSIIYPAFDLAENDFVLIKHWLHDTRVRWGKSAEHRQELGLFGCTDNTWQAMLDRLLMGYAIGQDEVFVDGILPYKDIEGSSALALGGLHDFIQLLFSANIQLKNTLPLEQWGQVLADYANQLLSSADGYERQQLNELLLELSTELATIHQQPVDLQVIILWLQDRSSVLGQQNTSQGFLRGQLTFCNMEPMRVVPAKIIALLGMNEGDFPRIGQQATFDLLAQHYRAGDSNPRTADRQQFLEILLSVQQQLLISFVGQSITNNNHIAPALVVTELMDSLQQSYRLPEMVIYHPLHAFSARYFQGDPALYSYSQTDCTTAKALLAPKSEPANWWQGELPSQAIEVIELADLLRFFQHPQRYFMNRQLDVRLYGMEAEPEERENFVLDGLDRYASLNDGIEEALQGRVLSTAKLQAQGRWLSGVMGDLEAASQTRTIDGFVERIQALQLGEKCEDRAVDIVVGGYRLLGNLGQQYQNGSLFYRYANLKGKDFVLAVLHHLIANQIQPHTTYLLCANAELVLLPNHCQDGYLVQLLAIYHQGQQRPDAFFTESALAYVQQASKPGASEEQALDKAKSQLALSLEQAHELELNRLYGLSEDLASCLCDSFEQVCRTVLLPLWKAVMV